MSNPNAGYFSMISLVDIITGAFGAVILLFAITPKGSGDMAQPLVTIAGTLITNRASIEAKLPDSLTGKVSVGDTLLFVVTDTTIGTVAAETPAPTPSDPVSTSDPRKPPPCAVAASTTHFNCNDNKTPDPNDDQFSFRLTVTGGQPGGTWEGSIAGRKLSGIYNVSVPVGPLPASQAEYALKVWDTQRGECVYQSIVPSKNCSAIPSPPPPGPTNPDPLPTISGGRIVVFLDWEGGKDHDLNLKVVHGRIVRYGGRAGNKRASNRHFTDLGGYEYVRFNEIYSSTFDVSAILGATKATHVKGRIVLVSRDANGRTLNSKTIPVEVNSRKRWQKIGSFELDSAGKLNFQSAN